MQEFLGQRLPDSQDKAEKIITKALADTSTEPAAQPPVTLQAWQQALVQRTERRAAYQQAFERAWGQTRQHVRTMAADPRFEEAMVWQNHRGFRTGVQRLANFAADVDNSKTRQIEQLVVKYVQRYCVRNDTIGFFGPTCWGRIRDDGPALTHEPGESLVCDRNVFFEDWAMTELCKTLDKNNQVLRPWLRPRRLPVVGLLGREAHLLMPQPMVLTPLEARVLAMCDGRIRARELAQRVLAMPDVEAGSEAAVFEVLDGLCKRGLAMWRIEVTMSLHANELLRELIEGIEEPTLREKSLEPLERLESALQVAASAEEADQALAALEQLDRVFEEITDQQSKRNAGQQYAARTLAAFDTTRTDAIAFGPGVTHGLAPVLSILMPVARWFTSEVGRVYREALTAIYRQQSAQLKKRDVPLLRLWLAAQSLFPVKRGMAPPKLLEPVLADLEARWHRILELESHAGEPRLDAASQDLLARMAGVFPEAAPGWSLARHHGVDIMLAGASPEAVARGDFQMVLGEFHCAMNTSISSFMLAHHPCVEDLYRLWEADFPQPVIIPSVPRNVVPVRMNRELAMPKDYRLEWAPDIAGPPNAQSLAAGDLLATTASADDDALSIRTRDGSLQFDVLEFFGQALSNVCAAYFKLPSSGQHTPRVTIDDVVICRESWKFAVSELDFCREKTADKRFLGARAWRSQKGVPRFCFFRTEIELKPIYLDFESPLLIDLFAHLCRAAERAVPQSSVSLSEMLPTHEQSWLIDRHGNHYANEVRLVAVDPAAPTTSG